MTLKWGMIPEYLGGPKAITRVLPGGTERFEDGYAAGFEDRKECRWPLEAVNARGRYFPGASGRMAAQISAQGDPFQTAGPQNCEEINLYCFKPPNVWQPAGGVNLKSIAWREG